MGVHDNTDSKYNYSSFSKLTPKRPVPKILFDKNTTKKQKLDEDHQQASTLNDKHSIHSNIQQQRESLPVYRLKKRLTHFY